MKNHRTRCSRLVVATTLLLTLLVAVPATPAQAVRAFSNRFNQTTTGDIVFAGNTLLTCRPTATNCTNAQNGIGGPYSNHQFGTLQYVDVDTGTTHGFNNSSAATLAIPPTGTVLFAGLYWGANSNSAQRGSAQFRIPGAGYVTVTDPDGVDTSGNVYQAFVDVTTLVQGAGSGEYTLANVAATTNSGRHAGWSLVVVYEDPNEPYRNLTVYDGFQRVNSSSPIDITPSGFVAPPTGPVIASIGFVAYEGDDGITGDYAQLNSTRLGDAVNSTTNFFNSKISDGGVAAPGRTPSYNDQLGFDATITDTVGVVPPGATSATIRLRSSGDWYYPGVVTAAIDVYVPNLVLDFQKSVTDANGAPTVPGDTLTYELSFTNQGDDAALETVLTDAIPANTTYVPGSATVVAGDNPGTTNTTYDATANEVTFNLGVGADASTGGRVAPFAQTGTEYAVRFQVSVDAGTEGLSADNTGMLAYTAETIGDDYTADSNTTTTPILAEADLSLTGKSDNVDPVRAGEQVQWTITAVNDGPSAAADTTITDTLPAGFSFNAPASDNRCSASGQVITCALGTLASGATDSVVIAADVAGDTAATTITNTATVSTSTRDRSATDDNASETTEVERLVDLEVAKTDTPSPVIAPDTGIAGGQISYQLTATNKGPSDAQNVVLTDALPTGVSVSSISDAACSDIGGAVQCTWPELVDGATRVITVVVDVPPTVATGATLHNTVSVTSDDPEDPSGGSNTASVQTPIERRADLQLQKAATGTPIAGTTLLYELEVENLGQSVATDVEITDTLPGGVTFNAALTSNACTDAAGVVTCELLSLDPGDSATFTIALDLPSSLPDGSPLVNEATVAANETDPDPANNTDDDQNTVSRSTDLRIEKQAASGTVAAGGQIAYDITVTNDGPSDATGVTVTDIVQPGTSLSSAPGCTGTTNLTCAAGSLAVGDSATFTITVDADAGIADGQDIVNSAVVTGNENDPDPDDNTSQFTVTADRTTELEITKSETAGFADPAPAGAPLSWDIEVTNLTTSDDTNVIVTDDLSGLPLTNAAASMAGATCTITPTPGVGVAAGLVTCTLASLAGSASATLTITGDLNTDIPDGTVLSNQASVSSDNSTGTKTATEETTIDRSADLELSKVGPTTVVAGDTGLWTITVTNTGPGQADDVVITDILPAAAQYVSHSVVPPSVTCTSPTGNLECDAGSVDAGQTVTVQVTARFARTETTGATHRNTAIVTSSTDDPDPSDNERSVESEIERSTDLSLTKVVSAPTANAGENISYTLTVTNGGPSLATGVEISDPIPSGLTFVDTASDSACDEVSGSVVCTIGEVDPLDPPKSVVVTFAIDQAQATGPITNDATVTGNENDTTPGNNEADDTFDVETSADLAVVKTSPAGPAVAGESYTYTIAVSNNGPSAAVDVVVTDTLPPGTALAGSTNPTCTEGPAGTVTCTLGTMPDGGTSTFDLTIDVPAAATTALGNSVSVSSDTADPSTSDNTSVDTSPVQGSSDLSITKSAPATIIAGTDLTWTIEVAAAGPSAATNTVVTDTLPVGLTLAAGSDNRCSAVDEIVTCTLGTMNPGATDTITLVSAISPSAPSGANLRNTAVIGSDAVDPTPDDNESRVDTRVERSADLASSKSASPAVVNAGEQVVYTVSVVNNGVSEATAVTLSDTLPTSLSAISATSIGSGSCLVSGQTVVCSAATLAPGATLVGEITATVDPSQNEGATIGNTVTAQANEPDPTSGNDSASTSIDIGRSADLALIKTADAAVVTAGEVITWSLEATNNGPSDSAAVTISDPVPANMTFDPASSDDVCTESAGIVSCTPGDLAAGDSTTVTIGFTVDSSVASGETLRNIAGVSGPEADPTSGNDGSFADVDIDRRADLATVKSSPLSPPVPGETTSWTIDVTNNGPSDAANVIISDTLPSGVTFVSTGTTPGCTETPVDSGIIECNRGSLANGDTSTVTIVALVDPSHLGSLENTASSASDEPDPDTDDNSSSVSDDVAPSADLTIEKVRVTDPVVAGAPVLWQLVVTNDGPSDAVDVEVTDLFPSILTYVDTASDSRCDLVGSAVSCEVGTMAPGDTETLDVGFLLAENAIDNGSLSNTTQVASATDDPDTDNNSSTEESTIERSADLAVNKTGPLTAIAGSEADYTIDVINNGPSTAANVRIDDALPVGATVVNVSGPGGCTNTASSVTCALVSMANGETATVTVRVRFDAAVLDGADLTNEGRVSSDTGDPDVDNNASSVITTVSRQADLVATKSVVTDPVVAGQPVLYQIDVVNNGPSAASGIAVADTLPLGLTFRSDLSSPGCTAAVSCPIGVLPVGATATVVVGADVASSTAAGVDLVNQATATGNETDPTPGDNTSQTTTPVTTSADLSIIKQGPDAAVTAGTDLSWTLTVTNSGPSDATGVVVTDTLPTGTTISTPTDGRCTESGGAVECNLGTVPDGIADVLTITVTTDPSLASTAEITNGAQVASNEPDPDPNDNTSSHTTDVERVAGLDVEKVDVADPVVAGRTAEWDITVSNTGVSTTDNVVVTDVLPTGATFVATGSDIRCSLSGGSLDCIAGTLAPGASETFRVIVDLDQDIADGHQLQNQVTADADSADPVTTSEETTVVRVVDLNVSKTADVSPITPGEPVVYTVVVENGGPSQATEVELIDVLPVGASVISVNGPTSCTTTSGVITCEVGTLDAGTDASYVFEVLPASYLQDGDLFVNQVSVSGLEDEGDPTNNSGGSSEPVARSIGLALTKTAETTAVAAGRALSYELTVENSGPSDASDVVIGDTLPGSMTFDPTLSTAGCDETAPGSGIIECSIGIVAAGAQTSVTIGVVIDAGAAVGDLVNTAVVLADEPNRVPNTAEETVTISALADLAVSKTGPGPITAGTTASYTIEVVNQGPSVATNVVVTDAVPEGASFSDGPPECSEGVGVDNNPLVHCDVGELSPGESASVVLDFLVDPGRVEPVINSASVSSDVPDADPSNSIVSVQSPVERSVDLEVDKSIVTGDVVAGGHAVWAVSVTNQGPSTATDLSIVDDLPAGFTFDPAGSSVECAPEGAFVQCTTSELAVGDTIVYTIDSTVGSGVIGDVTNMATATATELATAVDAEAETSVRRVEADLAITKTSSSTELEAGETVIWLIEVTNLGPEDILTPVEIADPLPDELTYVSHSVDQGAACSVDGQDVQCELDGLRVGQPATLTIRTTVNTAGTTLTNTATAAAVGIDNGTGVNGALQAAASAVIDDPPATGVIAFTGGESGWLAGIGAWLVAGGAALVFYARRRRFS